MMLKERSHPLLVVLNYEVVKNSVLRLFYEPIEGSRYSGVVLVPLRSRDAIYKPVELC